MSISKDTCLFVLLQNEDQITNFENQKFLTCRDNYKKDTLNYTNYQHILKEESVAAISANHPLFQVPGEGVKKDITSSRNPASLKQENCDNHKPFTILPLHL